MDDMFVAWYSDDIQATYRAVGHHFEDSVMATGRLHTGSPIRGLDSSSA